MLTYWGDIDSTLAWMDELRRRMDRAFEDYATTPQLRASSNWPRVNLYDTGNELVIETELPGFNEKDIELSLNQDVLTLRGERKVEVPTGYSVHRQERTPVQFARSFSFPCKVNPEKVAASLRDGILMIQLSKAPEAQPRQITVKAG